MPSIKIINITLHLCKLVEHADLCGNSNPAIVILMYKNRRHIRFNLSCIGMVNDRYDISVELILKCWTYFVIIYFYLLDPAVFYVCRIKTIEVKKN